MGAPDLARAYQGLTKIQVEIIAGRELAPDTGAVIGMQKFAHNLLGKSVAEHHLVYFDNLPESYRLKTPNFGGSQLLTITSSKPFSPCLFLFLCCFFSTLGS